MTEGKSYNPFEIESGIYDEWEKKGYFSSKRGGGKGHFTIMMPPPNVTGSLHIGHALNHTLQDIIVRYKRMDGYSVLWQPGLDHAGIATQNVVERRLIKEGKTKESLGREEFIREVYRWKEQSGGMILSQLRRLGTSPDWSRERFTMDDGLQKAVRKAFVKLYDDKVIFQGDYMINWCTHDGALSDIEVEHYEVEGRMYHIRYKVIGENRFVTVATTRPETYFGDTAVMVHPDDDRYKGLVSKKVRLPLIDREIPVIADSHVDISFGSGAVKVTPGHDQSDYEVGRRHNLEILTIFDEKGFLNDLCGEFAGLERLDARERIVQKLTEEGYIEKIEKHIHQVGHCYRCKNVVEPYISRQWFVKKEIACEAIKRVNAGETLFSPPQWKNNFDSWMSDLRDWCISRQLWWGHRIPVFYCIECGNQWASEDESPSRCPNCGGGVLMQDPNVLDTWFSSGLWAISTLGWGNEDSGLVEKSDLELRLPNSLLITGFDILFFWVARMLMMGVYLTGRVPFKDVYLHALVRDEFGNKMSKSKGNVIDPQEMIDRYGADTLRFTLAALCAQGRDIRLSEKALEIYKHFANKIFNAARYLYMKQEKYAELEDIEVKTELGRYMRSRFSVAVKEAREQIDSYRFNDAAITNYRFLWTEFCDWGIELSKADGDSIAELGAIFLEALKLLSPFMPFLTERLYKELGGKSESVTIAAFPEAHKQDDAIEERFNMAIEAIQSIRRAKVSLQLANKRIALAYLRPYKSVDLPLLFIEKLAKVDRVVIANDKQKGACDVSTNLESVIPSDSFDLAPILGRLEAQKLKTQRDVERISAILNNDNFAKNAPAEVLEKNRAQFEELSQKLGEITSQLNALY
jgi:valyl-tRNA synthetase